MYMFIRAPGLDVNGSLSRGLRPLHYAAYVDNHDAIQLLIYHDADPNLPDEVTVNNIGKLRIFRKIIKHL